MSDLIRRGRKATHKIVRGVKQEDAIVALLGRVSGSPQFVVTGKADWLYVRIKLSNGASTTAVARNDAGVPHILNLKVLLEREDYLGGQFVYVITGISRRSDAAYSHPSSPSGIPPHTHDDRYFKETEHIATSAGAGDAGKPIKLSGTGKIDLSMITGVILADGTVILTGDWDIGEDRRIKAEALRARDAEGLKLEDDAVDGYIHLKDGGEVEIRRNTPGILLNLGALSITEGGTLLQTGFIRTSSDNDINFTIVRTLATVGFMGAGVTGDTERRLLIYADGKIELGPGNAARDTNLYRSAANLWRTDDSMIIVGTLGVGIAPAVTQLHTVLSDAVTNAIVNILTMGHLSSGTPAAGFGAGLIAQLESSTTTHQDAGRLTFEWVTATHASRASKGKLSAYLIAAEVIGLTWDSAGMVQVPGTLNVVGAVDFDASLNVDGAATLNAGETVTQPTLGQPVQTLIGTATNDDVKEQVIPNKVTTTNATPTTLHTFAIPASNTVVIECIVLARRTGGTAGTADDGAAYKLVSAYTTKAGVVTLMTGGPMESVAREDVAGYDCALVISGSNVILQVTGVADTNISWEVVARFYQIGT